MARRTPFPNMVCGVCKTEFTPTHGQFYDKKKGRVHCCSKTCERVRRQEHASKLPINHKLECAVCREMFIAGKQQRYKYLNRPNYKPCCSEECCLVSNSENMKRRLREGAMFWWGSPAQLATAKKLGKYSLANKKFGREHPNWRNGLTTTEMLEVRRLRVNIKRYIKEGAN